MALGLRQYEYKYNPGIMENSVSAQLTWVCMNLVELHCVCSGYRKLCNRSKVFYDA